MEKGAASFVKKGSYKAKDIFDSRNWGPLGAVVFKPQRLKDNEIKYQKIFSSDSSTIISLLKDVSIQDLAFILKYS